MLTKNHPFLYLILKDKIRNIYDGHVGGYSIRFCIEILSLLQIPKDKIPYALFFHHGSDFVLEKKTNEDWVEGSHRLDYSSEFQRVKVLKTKTTYWFNGVDITNRSRPTDFDILFIYYGNKISFDCYYYE